MNKVLVTQIRSTIKRPKRQVLTIQALGLGKLNRTVEKELTPQIAGMINKVRHLVDVKEVYDEIRIIKTCSRIDQEEKNHW